MEELKKYDENFLLDLFKMMLRERKFDQNLIRLLHEGKVSGFYHSGIGQEAIAAGACAVLNGDDYIFYDHRGCNQQIAKGISLKGIYGDFLGRINGTTSGLGAGIVHHADPDKGILGQSGTIGESYVVGAGVGYSIKLRKTDQVCVVFNGDGATARELFHGGMNWAGLYDLPVVFIIENNKYGLSLHYKEAHALKEDGNLADRAEGYGIEGKVIDGNNVLEVYETTKEAVTKARKDSRPTLIEAMTFRHRGHFEGDPADYMDQEELKKWKEEKDPIKNFKELLIEKEISHTGELEGIENEVEKEIKDAIKKADEAPLPEKERIYQGLFAKGGMGNE
ncbi:MAG: thiamine pyrophosphate-dependent dehydrogenase E1 component subunit alpha [Halanaerobiales bacterium]